MKKAIMMVLVVVLLTSGSLVGCGGEVITRDLNFSDFTHVEVGHAFEVEIVQSDSYSVSITANEDLFNYIQVSQEGETLKINLTKTVTFRTRRAKITMPDLRALKLSGATNGTVKGFNSSHDFILDLSGASRLKGDIKAGDTQFMVSGASTVQLEGSADDIVVDASGASRVRLGAFSVNDADIKLSGASSGTINLDGRLDLNLSGASKLEYIGEPTMGTIDISGASSVDKK